MSSNNKIYEITCSGNGVFYLGKTSRTVEKRYAQHLQALRKNRHCNPRLQRSFNKYGESCFSVELLEENVLDVDSREKELIAKNRGNKKLANIHKGGTGGDTFTGRTTAQKKQTSAKMSAARKGLQAGKNNPMFGKTHSPRAKAKLSAANSGKNNPQSKITREMSQQILELLARGLSQRTIAEMFNVSRTPIGQIANGQHWTTKKEK